MIKTVPPPPGDDSGKPKSGDELLTVVVTCLNEEKAVGGTVHDILSVAKSLPLRVELRLIDDGSTDRTRQVMEKLCAAHPECSMKVNPQNIGSGRSLLNSYKEIDPDSWVTCFPGDNEMVFSAIRNYVAIREHYDLILGYLHNPVIRPIRRRLASTAFMATARFLYGYPYAYLNGVKMYRCWVFRDIETVSSGHAVNAELLAKAQLKFPDLRIGEAPFIARGRATGYSKAFTAKSILTAARETYLGVRSVAAYREQVIRQSGGLEAQADDHDEG